jgi:nucleoside 2-deoxyribosyltransferase
MTYSLQKYLNRAEIIVADVTGRNGNVFYELGMAHTIGKPVIIITQNKEDVPFDLRHLRFFKYSDNAEGWLALRKNLKKAAISVLGKRDT